MNVRSRLYMDIAAKLASMNKFKHIDLYNNQLEHLKEEAVFGFPAVFVEFSPIRWLDARASVQEADIEVMLHIVTQSQIKTGYLTNMATIGLVHLDLIDDVHNCIKGFQGTYFSRFVRTGSDPDHDHDFLWSNVERYKTHIIDNATEVNYKSIAEVQGDIQVSMQ